MFCLARLVGIVTVKRKSWVCGTRAVTYCTVPFNGVGRTISIKMGFDRLATLISCPLVVNENDNMGAVVNDPFVSAKPYRFWVYCTIDESIELGAALLLAYKD